MSIDPQKIAELRVFVELLDKKPELVHMAPLKFFKDFLVKWGANIPEIAKSEEKSEEPQPGEQPSRATTGTPSPRPEPAEEKPAEEEESEVEELPSEPDYAALGKDEDDDQKIEPETEEPPAQASDMEVDLSDEQQDKLSALKQEAHDALEDGDLTKALEKYTGAIVIGNPSALLYTRRAELLLKLKRPVAAIKDCDAALKLNPDSGKAYKVRGLAFRRLQKWEEAHKDFAMGQKIDYDEGVAEVHAFVDGKYKAIAEAKRAYELKDLLKDPKVMEAMQDCMKNPQNIMKYMNDKEIGPKVMKLMSMMGGMGGGMGGMGGMFGGGMPGAGAGPEMPTGPTFSADGGDP